MSGFSPRSGRSNYIKQRGNSFFYRRAIPPAFRQFFGGKVEWNIKLVGTTDASRRAEAGALAHEHNVKMLGDFEKIAVVVPNEADDTLSLKLDFSPEIIPVNTRVPPFKFHRGGKQVETYKFAASNDRDFLLQAESEGYFAMSFDEFSKQKNLLKFVLDYKAAEGPEAKQLAKLKHRETRRSIEAMVPAGAHTLSSIVPEMHRERNPREATKQDHLRVVKEFTALHGDMPLVQITKEHVRSFVRHVAGNQFKGRPIAPSTVKQRLEKLSTILQYAASVDAVEHNVAKAVQAPKDTRPLSDQTYKPFDKGEVRKIIAVATPIWAARNYGIKRTRQFRKADFTTALHILIWTGARPEEICQLRLADVDLERMGLVITNESDDLPVKPRQLKNEESVRGIPIHLKLLPRLKAHVEFVNSLSDSGLLFPSFSPERENGRYARPLSLEWTQTPREHITTDPQKSLYSLRHSWAGEAKRIGMPDSKRNAIMGHVVNEKSPSAKRYVHHFDDLENQLSWVNKMDCLQD